jgi:phage-related tail fiber protein
LRVIQNDGEIMATILTDAGRTKLLAATPMTPVTLSHIAFGDGSGSIPSVIATRTALVNELVRVDASNPVKDVADLTVIMVQGMIPRTFGGVTIREVGLFDNTNTLIAYGSVNNQELPAPTT